MSDQEPPAAATVEENNAPNTSPGPSSRGEDESESGSSATRRRALLGLAAGIGGTVVAANTVFNPNSDLGARFGGGGSEAGGGGGGGDSTPNDRAQTYREVSPAVLGEGPVPVHLWIDWADSDTHRWVSTVAPSVDDLLQAGHIRLYHHDFPKPATEMSRPLANSARGVLDGFDPETFWNYRKVMLREYEPGEFSYETIRTVAGRVGIGEKAADSLVQVARNRNYREHIAADRRAVESYGVTKLPAIVIGADAQFLTPEQAYDIGTIEAAVDARLPSPTQ